MSKAEFLQQVQESQVNEDNQLNNHLGEKFREYVKEHYNQENEEILNNPQILKMIYALEWYDIPRSSYTSLIEFHPYLTQADEDKMQYIKMQHQIENFLSFSLFGLLSNRLLMNKFSIFQRRMTRFPTACAISGGLTYLFNYFILRPIFLNDLDQMGLVQKYFYLDLNADLMKEDLEQLGFKIDAKNFDFEQIQERLEQKQQMMESRESSK